jgi:mannose-1-phosphate guanylyltransferase
MICALILAGGAGKRFWPLSTEEHPKQLLKLFSEETMIKETVKRILPSIPAEHIFIATNLVQSAQIKEELPMIPTQNIIIEPDFKDTAAAIGYSCLYIRKLLKDPVVVVLASDHLIKKPHAFREIVGEACSIAENEPIIITLGIKPTRPETGYGYIKVKGTMTGSKAMPVEKFLEKPNLENAEKYVAEGSYLWNSGMFIFKISTIMKEFELHLKQHMRILKNIDFYIEHGLASEKLATKASILFEDFQKISIDYGILEKTSNIKVIPADIDWYDIGSFSAFEELFLSDDFHNTVKDTDFSGVECSGNIIYTENLELRAVGLKDMIIVQSGRQILVCHKYDVDKIKQIHSKEELASNKKDD